MSAGGYVYTVLVVRLRYSTIFDTPQIIPPPNNTIFRRDQHYNDRLMEYPRRTGDYKDGSHREQKITKVCIPFKML